MDDVYVGVDVWLGLHKYLTHHAYDLELAPQVVFLQNFPMCFSKSAGVV